MIDLAQRSRSLLNLSQLVELMGQYWVLGEILGSRLDGIYNVRTEDKLKLQTALHK